MTQRASERALWKRPGYLLYIASRFTFSLLTRMLVVVVGWHVYELTGDPLHLGYVGLAMFLPVLLLGFVAGDFADRFNRAGVVLFGYLLATAAGAGMLILASVEVPDLVALYACVSLFGTAVAVSKPALWAILPRVVPDTMLSTALSWATMLGQVAYIVGPATGGLLLIWGPVAGYGGITLLSLAAALLSVPLLPAGRAGENGAEHGEPVVRRMLAGIRYIFGAPIILGMVTLDLLAVLLGSVVVLLPVFARDILGVGSEGLGVLRAAPAVGAMAAGLVLAYLMPRRNAGAIMLGFTVLFGLSAIVFAFSRDFTLSLLALAVGGAADTVSVVMRHTVLQLGTPDVMRGRVSAAAQVFISASNELGDFRSGVVASWLGAVPAVAIGGLCTILATAACTLAFPGLRRLSDPREVGSAHAGTRIVG